MDGTYSPQYNDHYTIDDLRFILKM